MRFHQMLHAALASVFVVPAVTLTTGEAQGLEQALAETVRAIESLTGLRTRLEDPTADATTIEDAVARVLAVTEEPKHDGPRQDELLATLRRDMSRLQMVLDGLTTRPSAAPGASDTAAGTPDEPPSADLSGTHDGEPPITTGLDDEARAALLDIQPPILEAGLDPGREPDRAPAPGGARRGAPTRSFEAETFTADALRLGHAYYRAGRYAEGLVILSKRPDDVEARYWSARCLEHLERYDEAQVIYEEVVAHPEAGYLADRAQSDLSFLRWKRDFVQRIDANPARSGDSKGNDE